MAITRGNTSAVGYYDVAGGTVTLAVTAGQGILAWVSPYQAAAPPALGAAFWDSDTNDWVYAGEAKTNDVTIGVYYVLKAKTSTTLTIACAPASGDFEAFGVRAYSPGSGMQFALDVGWTEADGVGIAADPGSIVVSDDAVIFVAAAWEAQGEGVANTADGYQLVSTNGDYNDYIPGAAQDKIVTTGGSNATSLSIPSAAWCAGVVSLKAVAASGSIYDETVALASSSTLTEAQTRALTQSLALEAAGAVALTSQRALWQAVALAASGALTPSAARVIARAVTLGVGAGLLPGQSGTDQIESVSGIRDDQQTGLLSFGSFVPPIGWQVTIVMSSFAQEFDGSQFVDTNGHGYSSPPDVMTPLAMTGGDPEDGVLGAVSTTVTSNSVTPFEITYDSGADTPGDSPGRYWTWAAICHPAGARPNVIDSDYAAHSNAASATAIPENLGDISITTPAGRWIAFFLVNGRGHDTRPYVLPLGWTIVVDNPENSAHQSGCCCYLTGSGVQTLTPQAQVIDIATGLPAEITGWRAAAIVYEIEPGSSVHNESITMAIATTLSGAGSCVIADGISLASTGGVSDGVAQQMNHAVALGTSAGLTPSAVATILGSLALTGQVSLTPAGSLVLAIAQALAVGADLATTSAIGAATYSLTVSLVSASGLATVSQQTLGAQIAMDLRSDIAATSQQITTALMALGVSADDAAQAGASIQVSLTLGVIGILQAAGEIPAAPVIDALYFASLALSSSMFSDLRISGPMFADLAIGPE